MIIGVGVDVVDVARFAEAMRRTPALAERLFTEAEQKLPAASLAARFAAKEALAKALGAPVGLRWRDAAVHRGTDGRPHLAMSGTVAARAEQLGVSTVHVSLSHDAGIASAMVVAEGDEPRSGASGRSPTGGAEGDEPRSGASGRSPTGGAEGDEPRSGASGRSPRGPSAEGRA